MGGQSWTDRITGRGISPLGDLVIPFSNSEIFQAPPTSLIYYIHSGNVFDYNFKRT
jgi:hypothetical protein